MSLSTKWITGALVWAGVIYILSPGPAHFISHPDGWELREQLVFLTGVSAMSLMVLSMVISIRTPWMNGLMKGLDKAYVVHKWTGIGTTLVLIFHWLCELVPEWLVELGLVPNPGELTDGSRFSDLEITLFQAGVTMAEFAFYGSVVLVVIALFKKIPYRLFRKTHKVFPVLFLLAAFHGATAQLKEHWLDTPAGYLLLVLITLGVVAALLCLFQRIGAPRKTRATIDQIYNHADGILDLRLSLQKPFKHEPGQYAFLRFPNDPEPHPFTIASSGDDPFSMRFAIKSLGDFTTDLANHAVIGAHIIIEGPYGEFTFKIGSTRQIWVSGGIGITPFMARLDYLSARGGTDGPIDFWYSMRGKKSVMFPDSLEELCRRSGVQFYHLNSLEQEYLTADLLHESVGSLEDTDIWFCGPSSFAECLLKGLSSYNFDESRFHFDRFEMR
ncbi:ferredoxin reductase family protein [Larkinella terrae]|uniref:Iron reductase n=1 Tax=Larkinella terrae TaxID=2025311 RepID=A0A7K0EEK9_9BACT|nr:ferric reductase-like transmembrane domain-containing protein [Larkinella terrae]MRS59898.1 iron reductase [Larkinella terrae]